MTALRKWIGLYWADVGWQRNMDLVKIRTFSGPTARLDAKLAESVLQAVEIECFVPDDGAVEPIPFFEVHLMVRATDADIAREALETYFDSGGPISPE